MDDGYYLVQVSPMSQPCLRLVSDPEIFKTPEGGFVLGGGFDVLVDEGLARPEQREGVTDDSDVIPEWTDRERLILSTYHRISC